MPDSNVISRCFPTRLALTISGAFWPSRAKSLSWYVTPALAGMRKTCPGVPAFGLNSKLSAVLAWVGKAMTWMWGADMVVFNSGEGRGSLRSSNGLVDALNGDWKIRANAVVKGWTCSKKRSSAALWRLFGHGECVVAYIRKYKN